MAKPGNPVQLAMVGAAHGIKGEVRVKPFTHDPLAFGEYGPLFTGGGRALTVAAMRPAKDVLIVRFEGVTSRDAAEALTGEALFVDRAALPREMGEDEYYHADLVGSTVVDEAGGRVGEVVAVHDFGAGDVLEIRPPAGPTHMIPFTREAVPRIELAQKLIRIDSAAAGLVEPAEEAEAHPAPRTRGPESAGDGQ